MFCIKSLQLFFIDRTLNSEKLWNTIQSDLEHQAIKISKEFKPYDGVIVYHYDIPITGDMIISKLDYFITDPFHDLSILKKRNMMQQKTWFYYNHQYYNPQFIYVLTYSSSLITNYLTPLCSNIQCKENDTQMMLGMIDMDENQLELHYKKLRSAILSNKQHEHPYSTQRKALDQKICQLQQPEIPKKRYFLQRIAAEYIQLKLNSRHKYYQIDLKDNYHISIIGVLGAYPSYLKVFSVKETEELPNKRRFRSGPPRNHAAKSIYIYDNHVSTLSYLESYDVYYRHLTNDTWVRYPKTFEGNCYENMFTEVRSSLNVMTRYLRIIPKEYHHLPHFRVCIYGEALSSSNLISQETMKNTGNTVSTSNKCVRYTLTPPSPRYKSDGNVYGSKRDDYYWKHSDSKHRIKANFKQTIHEEMEEFYSSMNDY